MKNKIIYFIEKLGNRIILKYFAENYLKENHGTELYAYEIFNYPSISNFKVDDWMPGIFKGHFNENDLNKIERICPNPGNLFVYAPVYIKKTGIYPSLIVPQKYKNKINEFIKSKEINLNRPKVCFHILTDAPYSRSRNHDFKEWKKCIELLKRQDVLIFRIGMSQTQIEDLSTRNVIDCTGFNFSPSESIAIIDMCDVYVGGDTGMTHAAAALGKNIVAVWGDITHMLMDKSFPNNIQNGDWDTGPYVPDSKKIIFRRCDGPDSIWPIFPAEKILEGINYFTKGL